MADFPPDRRLRRAVYGSAEWEKLRAVFDALGTIAEGEVSTSVDRPPIRGVVQQVLYVAGVVAIEQGPPHEPSDLEIKAMFVVDQEDR